MAKLIWQLGQQSACEAFLWALLALLQLQQQLLQLLPPLESCMDIRLQSLLLLLLIMSAM